LWTRNAADRTSRESNISDKISEDALTGIIQRTIVKDLGKNTEGEARAKTAMNSPCSKDRKVRLLNGLIAVLRF
jgi:hypothetical protein